jgi:hypothetical protein
VPSRSEAPNPEVRNPNPGQKQPEQSSTGNHQSAMPNSGRQQLDGMRLQLAGGAFDRSVPLQRGLPRVQGGLGVQSPGGGGLPGSATRPAGRLTPG